MNPFVWRGPEFLLFYLILAAAGLTWQVVRKSQRQAKAGTLSNSLNLSDPYEVAYLRAGPENAIRVGVVRLLDDAVLEEHTPGRIRRATPSEPAARPHSPVESAIYDFCRTERKVADIATAWPLRSDLAPVFAAYRAKLDAGGFLIGPSQRRRNRNDAVWMSTALLAVAGIKILYAWSNGHRNIWLLVGLALIATGISAAIGLAGRVTPHGTRTLANLRSLAEPAATTGFQARGGELAMAAALFGFAALPSLAGDQYRKLYGSHTGDGGDISSSLAATSSCGGGGDSGGCGGSGCGGCGGGGD